MFCLLGIIFTTGQLPGDSTMQTKLRGVSQSQSDTISGPGPGCTVDYYRMDVGKYFITIHTTIMSSGQC